MAKVNVMPDENFPYEKLALQKATPKDYVSAHPLCPLSKMHAIIIKESHPNPETAENNLKNASNTRELNRLKTSLLKQKSEGQCIETAKPRKGSLCR